MKRRPLALAAVTLFAATALPLGAAFACSMCQCGDAASRLLGADIFADQRWHVALDEDHLGKDQGAEGTLLRERESENRFTLTGAWSPLPSVRLIGRVPYAWRDLSSSDGSRSLSGLADPDLSAHLRLLRTDGSRPVCISAMLGVKPGWGQNDRTLGGVRAEEHLQPGSGAASWMTGLGGSVTLSGVSHAYVSVSGRWNGRNAAGYRYGDALLATVAWERAFSARAAMLSGLEFRAAKRDDDAGTLDGNSGGSVLYLAPRVRASLWGPVALKLGLQVPMFQNLFGGQNEHINVESGLVIAL